MRYILKSDQSNNTKEWVTSLPFPFLQDYLKDKW